MEEVSITQRVLNDQTMLVMTGDTVDNANAEELVKILVSALERGYTKVIIDMTKLEFLSSAGVGAIFSRVEPARQRGGDLILCNVSGNVLYVLGELDVAEHLTIMTSEQEAAARCGVELG